MTLEGCNQIGTEKASGVRKHAHHPQFVGLMNHSLGGEVTLLLGGLVVQQVVAERTTTREFASAGCLEPLGGSFAGLQLGHCSARPGTNDKNTP